MELDLTRPWRIFLAAGSAEQGFVDPETLAAKLADPASQTTPNLFAAAELAAALACILPRGIGPGRGDEGDDVGVIMLGHAGSRQAGKLEELGPHSRLFRRGFAWRASAARVELEGESEAALLAAVYDFLGAAGFRWPRPGEEALPPSEPGFLARASGRRQDNAARPLLILGHGSYVEKSEDYLLWAARNGYAGVFFHTTGEALAFGAAPQALYDSKRKDLLPLIARLGLEVELGGHGLSALLPRKLFKKRPELFRMAGGERKADRNFCPSNPESLAIVGESFAKFVRGRPEVSVFHVWPDDLPGGGWCECPACKDRSPAYQSLTAALALASILERERPGAFLSFLAYHDTEDMAAAIGERRLPGNLELLWAPRKRSWASGYGEGGEASLNGGSRANFETARRDFMAAGGFRVSIFEYWEDAILFKTAVPPLSGVMSDDTAYYRDGPRANTVGILLTGDRLPLAPRPNPWLLPRLLTATGDGKAGGSAQAGAAPEALMDDWCRAAYGSAAPAMARYWAALEAAWKIDLDLEPGETDLFIPNPLTRAVDEPFVDWGDPIRGSAERLGVRRSRCEELFNRLREAEAALAEARQAEADGRFHDNVEDEAREYAISSGILEVNCARLSAYHELASGSEKSAADIALIARSILAGVYRAERAVPDRRARRNGRFILFMYYELRLREMVRGGRHGIGQALLKGRSLLELVLRAARLLHVWED
jgi:hypothetical protein